MSAAAILTRAPQLADSETRAAHELAILMSRDGVFYDLDTENRQTGSRWIGSWDPQTDAGFIRPSLSFVAGDFDTKEGLSLAFSLKRQCPYPCAVLHSGGRNERAHLFIRVETKNQRLQWEAKIKAAGGGVRTQGIRPPGALHRTGQDRSRSAEGLTLQEVLDLLKEGKRQPSGKTKGQVMNLSKLASEPVPVGHRSDRLFLIACEAKRQRWGYEDFSRLILDHPEGAGEKIHSRTPEGQQKYLRGLWTKAPEDTATAGRWAAAAMNDPQVKRSRLNLEPVILHIEGISRSQGGRDIHLSVRDLADATNRSKAAANKAIRFLQDSGLLRLVQSGRNGSMASVYALARPESQKVDTQLPRGETGGVRRVSTFQDSSGLAFHDSLTGRNALSRCWLALDSEDPMTVQELAESLSRSRKTVYAHLRSLLELGLIARKGRGYVRVEDEAAHDGAARARGTLGRRDRRRIIHSLQRQGWKLEKQRMAEARIKEARREREKVRRDGHSLAVCSVQGLREGAFRVMAPQRE